MAISEKHKLFCKALLKHKFNQKRAYKEVYPDAKNPRISASNLLTKINVQEYLNKLTEKQEKKDLVTIEEVIDNIKIALENDKRKDDKGTMNTNGIYKGSDLLGKYLGAWKDNIKHTGSGDGGEIKIEFIN